MRAEPRYSGGRAQRECLINLPTTALADQVVGVGNSSDAEIDKFAAFALTPGKRGE